MHYNLFLDDERFPSENPRNYTRGDYLPAINIIVRNYDDFVWYVNHYGLPSFVSFDHDLGTTETGLTCARFLVDYCLDNNVEPTFTWYCHSQNPVGRDNINSLLNNFINTYRASGE